MKVAVLGTGSIGRGYAAFLAAVGHRPVLASPTGRGLQAPGCALISSGVVAAQQWIAVAPDCATAVAEAEVVLIAVGGNGMRATLEAAAPAISDGQTVIISGHLSFAALYLGRLLAARGLHPLVVAWASTALTARRGAAARVHISGQRPQIDLAAMPATRGAEGLAVCEALFGAHFRLRADVLAIMLSNLNPPSHMANMLCNFTRAEKGEKWLNYEGITPAVARLMEALDSERLALAARFGLEVRSIEDHFVLSFNVPRASLAEMARAVAAQRQELFGPTTLDTRFVTEDVPFGLVPLVDLGRAVGTILPLHEGGIALFSALYGRDFRAENNLLPALNLAGWDVATLHALLSESWPDVSSGECTSLSDSL